MDISHLPVDGDHLVTIRELPNSIPEVSASVHLSCTCGWSASAESPELAAAVHDEHLRTGVPAPIPASPSPD